MSWIKSSILYLAAYCFFMLIYMLAVAAANLLSVQPGQGSLVTSIVPYFTSAVAGILGAGLGLYGVARFFPPTIQCRTIFWIHFTVIIFIQIFTMGTGLYLYTLYAVDPMYIYGFYSTEPSTVYLHTITSLFTAWKITNRSRKRM